MGKRPENSWRQANSQGIWRKFGAKTESTEVQKTAERPGWERGLSGLSYYRFATIACDVTISMFCAFGAVGHRRSLWPSTTPPLSILNHLERTAQAPPRWRSSGRGL